MKTILPVTLVLLFLLSACANTPANQPSSEAGASADVTVFKAPTWGCCGDWIAHLEENGIAAKAQNVENLAEVKSRYQVPPQLQACHTAIVDGYIIEGHVPVAEIERLLAEKPDIAGLAVPGMPIGSPGMEVEGAPAQPFQVIAFDESGKTNVFATYPK